MLSQKENSIHAVEDQSDYNFQENNGRVIQSNDLNEDFEGALLDLYKSLVIGGQLLFTWFLKIKFSIKVYFQILDGA